MTYERVYSDWSAASVFVQVPKRNSDSELPRYKIPANLNAKASKATQHDLNRVVEKKQSNQDEISLKPTRPMHKNPSSNDSTFMNWRTQRLQLHPTIECNPQNQVVAAKLLQKTLRLMILKRRASEAAVSVNNMHNILKIAAGRSICRFFIDCMNSRLAKEKQQKASSLLQRWFRKLRSIHCQKLKINANQPIDRCEMLRLEQERMNGAIKIQYHVRKRLARSRASRSRIAVVTLGLQKLSRCLKIYSTRCFFSLLFFKSQNMKFALEYLKGKFEARRLDYAVRTLQVHFRYHQLNKIRMSKASIDIQRFYRGYRARKLACELKRKFLERFQCRNCGLNEPGGNYCKGCGRPRNKTKQSKKLGCEMQMDAYTALLPSVIHTFAMKPPTKKKIVLPPNRQYNNTLCNLDKKSVNVVQSTKARAFALGQSEHIEDIALDMLNRRLKHSTTFF
jgi:hypothetical protein